MKRLVLSVSAVLLIAGLAFAQDKIAVADPSAPRTLVTKEFHPSEFRFHAYMGDVKCDSDGSVYFKSFERDEETTTVYRIAASGRTTQFTLPAGEATNPVGVSFAVSPDGAVYHTAWDYKRVKETGHGDLSIFDFRSDGTFERRVRIEDYINPKHLAVFPGGEFLLAGLKEKRVPGGMPVYLPFTAIYDDTGKKLRELEFEADLGLKQAATKHASDTPDKLFGSGGEYRAIHLGSVRIGPDGLAYLMRRGDPAVIYVFNAGGEIVRKLEIQSPGGGKLPYSFQVSGGRIALQFANIESPSQSVIIYVLDATSGEKLATYTSERLRTSIACYSVPDQFTFITYKNGKLGLEIAAPE